MHLSIGDAALERLKQMREGRLRRRRQRRLRRELGLHQRRNSSALVSR